MIKKSEINSLLIQLDGHRKNGNSVQQVGLLNEKLSLGTKRIIKNITKELAEKWVSYLEDLQEIDKAVKDNPELNRDEEIKKLNAEEFELASEKFDKSFIDGIQSDFNYDFDLLEKISK